MKINASIRVCWAHSRRVRALHKHPDQDKPQAYWKPWQCPKAKQIALKTQTKPEKKHNNLLAQVAPSIRIWFDGEPILSPLYATSHALRTTLKRQFILRATNQLRRERERKRLLTGHCGCNCAHVTLFWRKSEFRFVWRTRATRLERCKWQSCRF